MSAQHKKSTLGKLTGLRFEHVIRNECAQVLLVLPNWADYLVYSLYTKYKHVRQVIQVPFMHCAMH